VILCRISALLAVTFCRVRSYVLCMTDMRNCRNHIDNSTAQRMQRIMKGIFLQVFCKTCAWSEGRNTNLHGIGKTWPRGEIQI